MSAESEGFRPFLPAAFELRVSERALEDLECASDTLPGDLESIETGSTYSQIVSLFRSKYRDSPRGTGIPLHNAGRNDVIGLHGPAGGRAATWYDEENAVCWLLAFTPEHDYTLIEQRAAVGELLPSEDDLVVLILERETLNFDQMFKGPVSEMLKEAMSAPGTPVRRTVSDMLQIEIIVEKTEVEESDHEVGVFIDAYLSVRMPPIVASRPPGWPGAQVAQRLMELATGLDSELSLRYPEKFPDGLGGTREIAWGHEIAVQVCSLGSLGGSPRFLDEDGFRT